MKTRHASVFHPGAWTADTGYGDFANPSPGQLQPAVGQEDRARRIAVQHIEVGLRFAAQRFVFDHHAAGIVRVIVVNDFCRAVGMGGADQDVFGPYSSPLAGQLADAPGDIGKELAEIQENDSRLIPAVVEDCRSGAQFPDNVSCKPPGAQPSRLIQWRRDIELRGPDP